MSGFATADAARDNYEGFAARDQGLRKGRLELWNTATGWSWYMAVPDA